MNGDQFGLFDAVSSETSNAIKQVEENADPNWKEDALQAVYRTCVALPEFISDDVWRVGDLEASDAGPARATAVDQLMNSAVRSKVNHMLALHGLGQLNDPGLPAQLGFLVRDHEHFRQLLAVCEPENRNVMYESLRPNLRFVAKPLDVYIAETRDLAARQQLPTVTEDGALESYRIPDIRTTVQLLVETAVARGVLTLVCRKCTFEDSFTGLNRSDAIRKAREDGWVYAEPYDAGGIEICPKCSELTRG